MCVAKGESQVQSIQEENNQTANSCTTAAGFNKEFYNHPHDLSTISHSTASKNSIVVFLTQSTSDPASNYERRDILFP